MISEYENLLRKTICLFLGDQDDVNFGVTSDRIEKWKEKRAIEAKKNKVIENRIIYYSDFYDLKTIITKHWLVFKPIFIEKKRFEVYFSEVENLRNTIAHGREILSFQRDILNGIIGDLKNQIVNYHNQNMKPDDFFIKILSISDNLGNRWDGSQISLLGTKKTLRVGDYLEFVIDAFDPKGREIEYEIKQHFNVYFKGKENIKIKITDKMISKTVSLKITASTVCEEYDNSDSVTFIYTVIP